MRAKDDKFSLQISVKKFTVFFINHFFQVIFADKSLDWLTTAKRALFDNQIFLISKAIYKSKELLSLLKLERHITR